MSVFGNLNERAPAIPERRPATPAPQSTPSTFASEPSARKVSVLGRTLVFKGELSAEEDLVLQGRVEGSIHHTQSVTIGPDGVVIGDIHAKSIVIEGNVEGDLHATASVNVTATGNVKGNIAAPRVGIVEGAQFNGSIAMAGVSASSRTPLSDNAVDRMLSK